MTALLRRRPADRSRLPRRAAAVLLAGALLVQACSHGTPYYRDGRNRWASWVPEGDVAQRLLLIGDAGDPDPAGEPALVALARQVNRIPGRTTVVFLGDNVYERGMPPPAPEEGPATEVAADVAEVLISDIFQTRKDAERKVNAQIDVVRGNGARAVFVPGNHDWDQFMSGGRERVLALESFVQGLRTAENLDVSLQPPAACPGPVSLPLGDAAELIAIDTQWWIEARADDRVTPDNNPAGCPYTTEAAVQDALLGLLKTAARAGRRTVVVGHHPLATKGAHSGFVEPLAHLFPARIGAAYVPFYVEWLPMPVLGSLVVGVRWCCSPSAQDTPNRRNRHMRAQLMLPMIEAAAAQAAPLAYAAGHDHDLQVFESGAGPRYLLVSGLGSSAKASPVGSNRRTLFAHSSASRPGFMQIDFLHDGRARLAVIEYTGKDEPLLEVYSTFMTDELKGAPARASA